MNSALANKARYDAAAADAIYQSASTCYMSYSISDIGEQKLIKYVFRVFFSSVLIRATINQDMLAYEYDLHGLYAAEAAARTHKVLNEAVLSGDPVAIFIIGQNTLLSYTLSISHTSM